MVDHDEDPMTAWVHDAYAQTPPARDAAVERTMNAARDAIGRDTAVHATAFATQRSIARRQPRLIRYTATVVATAAVIAVTWVAIRPVADHEPIVTRADSAAAPPETTRANATPARIAGTATSPAPSGTSSVPATPRADATTPNVATSRPVESPTFPSVTTPAAAPPNARHRMDSIPSQSLPSHLTPAPATVATSRPVTDGLDPESAQAVTRIFDSATARGLPVTALAARVREGVRRGVPGTRIVVVARNYATALADAQTTLDTRNSADIQSGAEALLAGAPVSALRQIRAARPTASIAEPLVALADLSAHGVAPLQAAAALSALMSRSSSDAPIRTLREQVIGDIIQGTAPDAALAGRSVSSGGGKSAPAHTPLQSTSDSLPARRANP